MMNQIMRRALFALLLALLAWDVPAALGFLDDLRLSGDLDGDSRNELALLFRDDPGGSGTFVYLDVIRLDDQGSPRSLFALVGDQVQVLEARIENGALLLEVIQPGEGEASCCGSLKVLRRWKLEGDALVELPAEIVGKVSLEDLEGKRWVLRSFGDEPLSGAPEITLEVKDGQFLGSGGCNRYFAGVSNLEAQGRAIEVGPVGSTRKACPPPVMEREQKYLEALRRARSFSIEGRQLVLGWSDGGRHGTLQFEETPPSH